MNLEPGEDAVEPLAVLFSWIPINICYTSGWVIELLAFRKGWKSKYLLGPALLRIGIGFSLFAVLLPSVLTGISLLISGIVKSLRGLFSH